MNVSLQKPVRGFGKATLARCASSVRNFQTALARLASKACSRVHNTCAPRAMKPGDYTLVVRVTW